MDFRPGSILPPKQAAMASELLPDGMVAAEADATVSIVNRRAAQILGIDPAELVGRDIRTALVLRDNDGTDWWDLTDPWNGLDIRTGHREKYLMVDGGAEVLVTAKYLRPGRNQPVNRVIVMLRDAEARRRLEADHAALISTVAHELRSPLTSVKGFSSTLLRRWDRFTDDQKRLMLETIEADADRVTRLITELLDVSRIDSGRLQIRPLPIDVAAVFGRHVERAVASGQERERFSIEVPDTLPEVWADPDRLDQILSNLIENAFRHGDGVVTLGAQPATANGQEVLESKGHSATGVDLVVSDEGKGIAADHRDLVFSRFWHGSGRGSTGLGLYVVKGLVEAHGGRVQVESAPSGGAQFRLSLPSEPPDYLA
ncbi:signal transduction histidine kinase [Phycicoccus badiiscoriae]|uniref:histidine kinase n=1 Tax=Pedococcus badiiscoriae TaxID=642776 RepID=A0A852WG58_9MICO|nr:ATP-binding protein [Pedococcus badiiscoriae]NYG08233.1 signal transduction histidine kinase [Pedococcus badiiscoriae]